MATKKQTTAPTTEKIGRDPEDPTGEGGVDRNKPGVKVVEEAAVQTSGRVFEGFRPSQPVHGTKITRIDH